jgi:cardiolipin synthase
VSQLRDFGVRIQWFNPPSLVTSLRHRTHRKLAIIDRSEATIGGMNWGAEFSELESGSRSCWRDVALWITGELVGALQAQFDATWCGDPRANATQQIHDTIGAHRFAVGGGECGRTGHRRSYRAMASSAQHELLLATPYFLPDAELRKHLCQTAARGVRVAISVPRRCDIGPFKHAARACYYQLLSSGVEIWERLDRMVHAKVAVVDRAVAAIGSVNLTRQSLDHNSETLVLTSQRRIVSEIGSFLLEESTACAEGLAGLSWRDHPDRARLAELAASSVGLVF